MVLVIFADAVEWMDDRNAMTFQLIARTDAREHENLRRVLHARAEDDFVRDHRELDCGKNPDRLRCASTPAGFFPMTNRDCLEPTKCPCRLLSAAESTSY